MFAKRTWYKGMCVFVWVCRRNSIHMVRPPQEGLCPYFPGSRRGSKGRLGRLSHHPTPTCHSVGSGEWGGTVDPQGCSVSSLSFTPTGGWNPWATCPIPMKVVAGNWSSWAKDKTPDYLRSSESIPLCITSRFCGWLSSYPFKQWHFFHVVLLDNWMDYKYTVYHTVYLLHIWKRSMKWV